MNSVNIAALVLRLAVGGTMIAHGWNHAFGGGRLPGTARWFESIGIRPGRVHALAATVTELGAGALLLLGLLTPLAAAGVVGTMVVALIANRAFAHSRPHDVREVAVPRHPVQDAHLGQFPERPLRRTQRDTQPVGQLRR